MTRGLFARLSVIIVVVVLAMGSVIFTTQAGDVKLKGAHWAQTKTPFRLQIGNNVSQRWTPHLRAATKGWRKSKVVRPRIVGGKSSPRNCDPTNGRVEVCSNEYGKNGWLGLSRIWIDNKKHIVRASVLLNDSYFRSGQYNDPGAMRHTMCHELGHVLGLNHTNSKSCMNDSQQAVFQNLKPLKRDYKRLQRLYNHTDKKATVGAKAVSGEFFDPGTLPELPDSETISSSESVRIEAVAGGGYLVTFITWADE